MDRPQAKFHTSEDGTRIAWSVHGSGYPLVRVGTFMTHLLRDWDSPIWGHWNRDLGARFTYIRYDERGCGLSERDPQDISLEAWIGDLTGVIEASGFDRVALLGTSHATALAVEFAARFPEKVSHIISLGGYAVGNLAPGQPDEGAEKHRVFADAVRVFWEDPDEVFRRTWANTLIPGADDRVVAALEHLMRVSSTGDIASRILMQRGRMDVRQLAMELTTPALIAHSRRDRLVPFDKSVQLAGLLPNASLLALDSENHIPLPGPVWEAFVRETTRFVDVEPVTVHAGAVPALTGREHEVLVLVAVGRSNQEIADEMTLSVRTVERHLSNIYRKLGVEGRNARAAAAGRLHHLGMAT